MLFSAFFTKLKQYKGMLVKGEVICGLNVKYLVSLDFKYYKVLANYFFFI